MVGCRVLRKLPKCSRATGKPREARGGVKLEAVEGVGRAAVFADSGGVHVDGVSLDMSGQGITAQFGRSSWSNGDYWKRVWWNRVQVI